MTTDTRPAILIVEDELIIARDLQLRLTDMGYDAFAIATSAEEALAEAAARLPDLVLMDIRIQGSDDGIVAAAALRERFHVPVVYLTAHADGPMIERAKKTEPYGYLLKPIKEPELRSTLEISLYRHKLEHQREVAARVDSLNQVFAEIAHLKEQILGNLSHELRTPLNGVIGFAELMHEGIAGPVSDKHREILDFIVKSGRRFLTVVTHVLELTDLEAGRWVAHPESIELRSLIDAVIGDVQRSLAERQHHIQVTIDPACAEVVNDRRMLGAVVTNFLSNAVKYTPIPGPIVICATPEDDGNFRIAVQDTGAGVDPKDAARLFDLFEPLDGNAREAIGGGAGMGLALCRRIAVSQGGQVGVNPAPGGGSTFFAILPGLLR